MHMRTIHELTQVVMWVMVIFLLSAFLFMMHYLHQQKEAVLKEAARDAQN